MCGADPARLDVLAACLLRARGPVAAEALAAELDCSPAQVAVRADALRGLGAPLAETPAGYVLALEDPLDEEAIRKALPDGAAMTVKVFRVCASTRVEARRQTPPVLCLAEAQTAGRGRRGTQWLQAFGEGLALSLAAAAPRGRLDPLAIALAVAVARCLGEAGYADIGIKWPNDLYVRGVKLGGLMAEVDGVAGRRLYVGLGLNVNSTPALPERAAIALAELPGPAPDRNRLAAALGAALMNALHCYDVDGFEAFMPEFAARDGLANRRVTMCDGEACIEGVARGIDDYGALILDTCTGRRLCRAGEVTQILPVEKM